MQYVYEYFFTKIYGKLRIYETIIEPQVLDYGIPKNLLQPIIENYFVNGLRMDSESNHFTIHGWLQETDILFTFDDNGRGMERKRLEEIQGRLRTMKGKSGIISTEKCKTDTK